ncbi:MAG: Arginine transport system permease protein ArtQ [Chlamydiae bacterium]|nr:Arginine transport system permease protein ArtQ [Chlamydiota bacterium]
MIDFSLIVHYFPALLHGALLSLMIAAISGVLGMLLGTLMGVGLSNSSKWIRFPLEAYVSFFRGTPMLIQIMFVFYVLPQLGITIPALWAASLAIGLNSAAYISQVVLSGIQAVPKGQIEAAKTLGMSSWQTAWHIVIPQAFRMMIPTLGNEIITLIKDSSLASIIGVMELSKEASIIRSRTFDAVTVLFIVSCMYLTMTIVISWILKMIERRSKYVSLS